MRNWLGKLVAARVYASDTVLDIGAGIMQATGPLGRCHLAVDCFEPYLHRVKVETPTALLEAPGALSCFVDKSWDVVLLLDVLEHMEKPAALETIAEAERIARRLVVAFTPDGFEPQPGWDAWGLGHNERQAHLCGFTAGELEAAGYDCSLHKNGSKHAGKFMAVLGFKEMAK